jgi:hypothetical protein
MMDCPSGRLENPNSVSEVIDLTYSDDDEPQMNNQNRASTKVKSGSQDVGLASSIGERSPASPVMPMPRDLTNSGRSVENRPAAQKRANNPSNSSTVATTTPGVVSLPSAPQSSSPPQLWLPPAASPAVVLMLVSIFLLKKFAR